MSQDVFDLRSASGGINYLDCGYSPPEPEEQPVKRAREQAAPRERSYSPQPRTRASTSRGRATHAGSPPQTAPAQGTDGDEDNQKKIPLKKVQEHQALINQINAYFASDRFRPVLENCHLSNRGLFNKSINELKELLERIRSSCLNCGSTGIVASGITMACGVAEKMMPKRLMDLEGLGPSLQRDPEFATLCEMVELDSGFKASMTPMQQLTMCMGKHAMVVAAQNKLKHRMMEAHIAEQEKRQMMMQGAMPPPAFPEQQQPQDPNAALASVPAMYPWHQAQPQQEQLQQPPLPPPMEPNPWPEVPMMPNNNNIGPPPWWQQQQQPPPPPFFLQEQPPQMQPWPQYQQQQAPPQQSPFTMNPPGNPWLQPPNNPYSAPVW